MGSFPVWSGLSLIFFSSSLGVGVILKRVFFLLFLEVGMFFILGVCLDTL